MMGWETTSLDVINNARFELAIPGPLHKPIHRFAVRRDDMFRLVLETEGPGNATSTAIEIPPGTVRFNSEVVELTNIAGAKAVLSGVEPYSYSLAQGPHANTFKEAALVHQLTAASPEREKAAYTIEWLENVPGAGFIWPDLVKSAIETRTRHRLALTDDGITLLESDHMEGSSRSAARLTIAGYTLFLCGLRPKDLNSGIHPGCIVYVGTPSDSVRKKIRTALSLALGCYLIELGHTLYDQEWRSVHVTLRSAYSPYGKSFPGPVPMAPVSDGRTQNVIDRATLSRMVNAFVDSYERLDLANLSWSYWHACSATIHIAHAQFGAAIEALQRTYIEHHTVPAKKQILSPPMWKDLRKLIKGQIESLDVSDEDKHALSEKLIEINRTPQRTMQKAVAQAIGIEVGSAENVAWARRNSAAHGMPIPEGEELAAIRDIKLLKVLFHRLLLGCTKASDFYIDYVSVGHPYRRLSEPIPERPGNFAEKSVETQAPAR